MSKVFRAKMVAALRKEKLLTKQETQRLFKKNWVIYCKQPFFGPLQVVEYLGRYTHKIAISNHRIIEVGNDEIKFSAKDYRKGEKKHVVSLKPVEFIKRFAMHNLPRKSGYCLKASPESGTLVFYQAGAKRNAKPS